MDIKGANILSLERHIDQATDMRYHKADNLFY